MNEKRKNKKESQRTRWRSVNTRFDNIERISRNPDDSDKNKGKLATTETGGREWREGSKPLEDTSQTAGKYRHRLQ
jgi:hypothetical protein